MAFCAVCGKKAVFKDCGFYLCKEHFSEKYEREVLASIKKYGMISEGDRICVGFSGGKDSTVLLSVLSKLDLGAELIAVTVDEGIAGYRNDTIAAAEKTAASLGVEHRIVSFTDLCGNTLDELLSKNPNQACSVCGTLRRRALNSAARDCCADKIATGHCMDDEAQSVLMNYLRGDITRITASQNTNSSELFIQRIKPLCRQTERSTVAYGIVNNLLEPLPECPYTKYALRADVRSWLGRMENEKPKTMRNIVDGQERLLKKIAPSKDAAVKMGVCKKCGEPTQNKLCAACTLLEKIL
ncbi:MAG: TIGR00269 family protein [Methanocorpusculum sp.]|nr:TIGR00269 family protein [Methanocorpusculum sp.]